MAEHILRAENVCFKHDSEEAFTIQDFSFSFPESGMVGLLGPNGVGKSTLMALLAGVFMPASGKVYVEGKTTDAFAGEEDINQHVTFIFQNMEFETDAVVADLMEMVAGRNPDTKRASISALAEEFGISGILKNSIQKVSKGELQKVILCFALLSKPRILLLDEPVFALRREDALHALEVLRRYCHEHNLLVVFSMHEIEYMEKFSEAVILFHKDSTYETGPASECLKPEKLEAVYGVPYSMLKLPASTGTAFEELEHKHRQRQP